jgi:hypothetical protein
MHGGRGKECVHNYCVETSWKDGCFEGQINIWEDNIKVNLR